MENLTVEAIVWGVLPILVFALTGAVVYEWRHELVRYVQSWRAGLHNTGDHADSAAISDGESNTETPETGVVTPQIDTQFLLRQGEARAVAKLLYSGLCKGQKTELIRCISGSHSGDGYSSFKRLVDGALAELDNQEQPHYRTLDDERRPVFKEG